jgi:hypothetical protein
MMFVPHWKHMPPLPYDGDSFALLHLLFNTRPAIRSASQLLTEPLKETVINKRQTF